VNCQVSRLALRLSGQLTLLTGHPFDTHVQHLQLGSQDAASISLWEHKSNADDYNTRVYPEVLKTLAKVIDGTPRVQTFETVVSTFHNVRATV
jgi:hypothetical protein